MTSLPRWGGGEKWFLTTALAMAERGHRVCLIAQPQSDILTRAQAAGLRCFAVPMHGIFDPRTLLRLAVLLRREGTEVAVANQAREIRLLGLSQLFRRGFRLVARRGSPDPIKDVWHFRFVYAWLVHRMIVNAQALVPRICDGAPWFDRDKIRVIPNGIDVEAVNRQASAARARAALGLDNAQRLVTMLGEVGWRKDQATFLRAVARIDVPGVVFAIVGEGDERPRLMQEAERLGLAAPRLRWLGFRADGLDILAASDLVVLPSREEGFPNTLLEAMALGSCVIATPVDGTPELVVDGQCGRLVPVGDEQALAEAMRSLLENDNLRETLARAGQARVRSEFRQELQLDRIESLFYEVLDGSDTAHVQR